MSEDERYVLHPSFAALWWQSEHPRSDQARDIRRAMLRREYRAVVAEDIALHVLGVLARVYTGAPLTPADRRELFADVIIEFRGLDRMRAIRLVPRISSAAAGFAAALIHGLALDDAQYAYIAVSQQIPLLVSSADPVLRDKLLAVAARNPALQLGWV